MNITRKIAKNTLILLAGQVITVVLTYFYTVYTARYLGVKEFGILSFAIAFTALSCLLADLGLSILTVREVSRNNSLADKYIGNVLVIKIILTIVTLVFTAIVINILGCPFKTVVIIYLITLSAIFASFSDMFYSIFQAFQKMEYISVGKILHSVLLFFGILTAINKNLDITSVSFIYFLASLAVLAYSFHICIRKFLIPKIEIDIHFWKSLIKESIPFWMTSVFVIIYFRIDMIMLSMMKGDEAVGWYAASYKLIDGLSIFPAVFMSVMFPVFSKYYLDSKSSLDFAFEKSLKYLVIVSIPIGIGTTLFADEIIMLFYGNEYTPSVAALKILIWASVLSFINWTPATLLNSTNKQRTLMIFTSIGAIVNLVLNYLLIPSLSYKGAGIATVITELVVGLLVISSIQKTQNLLSPLTDSIFKSLISGIIMGVFIILFKHYTLLLLLPVSTILYFVILFVVHGVGKEDLNLLNQARDDKNG